MDIEEILKPLTVLETDSYNFFVKRIKNNIKAQRLEEKAKEKALISSYIIRHNLLNDTFFNSFDKSYKIAEEFLETYGLDFKWGEENLEWDETVEKFVEEWR